MARRMPVLALPALLALLSLAGIAHAQPPLGGGVDSSALDVVEPGTQGFNAILGFDCNPHFREANGICTNDRGGQKKLWGSAGRPQFSYFVGRPTTTARGAGLRSPRQISNILSTQKMNIFDERRLSEIAVFFGQFVDHTLVATPLNEDEPFPIDVVKRDSVGRKFGRRLGNRKELPFTRSQRVRVRERDNQERPSNSLGSAMDLTNVYGATKQRMSALRVGKQGRLRISDDTRNFLPKNTGKFNNAPGLGPEFFLAGDHRANEHPVLTSLHTLFMREHNRIADEINEAFPMMSENMKFNSIKKINEAQFQRIVFEEWFPAITGRSVPAYRGFQTNTDLTVSLTFSTAGFRVGHTMVGNEVKRKGPGNKKLESRDLTKMFFQVVNVLEADGVEPFLRGAINTRAQKVDLLVNDALREGLFTNITNEGGNFDLVALNLQRGRDHALPSYNAVRLRFGRPKALKFREISANRAVQSRLQTAYSSAGRVEAFPGLLAEDHEPGSSFGPTLLSLWRTEFARIRNGDRLYFRRRSAWPDDLLTLPRVKRLLRFRKFRVFRQIILDNTDITKAELPEKLFFVDP